MVWTKRDILLATIALNSGIPRRHIPPGLFESMQTRCERWMKKNGYIVVTKSANWIRYGITDRGRMYLYGKGMRALDLKVRH